MAPWHGVWPSEASQASKAVLSSSTGAALAACPRDAGWPFPLHPGRPAQLIKPNAVDSYCPFPSPAFPSSSSSSPQSSSCSPFPSFPTPAPPPPAARKVRAASAHPGPPRRSCLLASKAASLPRYPLRKKVSVPIRQLARTRAPQKPVLARPLYSRISHSVP